MKHWEFLLQKKGDRSWLPLESSDVEILEGEYRIVARSSQVSAEVDVWISHLAIDADPPKRRTQKRSSCTNSNGLMVVIPFTRLEAGIWELQCSSIDPMSDLLGSAWRHSLQLYVQPCESEVDDWEPDWSPVVEPVYEPESPTPLAASSDPVASVAPIEATPVLTAPLAETPEPEAPEPELEEAPEPEPEPVLDPSIAQLIQLTEELSDQLVDDLFRELDQVTDQVTDLGSDASIDVPPTSVALVPTAFAIQLEREALMARAGQDLILAGQITAETGSPHLQQLVIHYPSSETSQDAASDPWDGSESAIDLSSAVPQEVQLCLRDPQSLRILVSDCQPLPDQPFPVSFCFRFRLPDALTTRLVLGELLLCGTVQPETSIVLAMQPFSVTVNPAELVEELTKLNEVLEEPATPIDLSFALAARAEEAKPSLELSFLQPAAVAVEPASRLSLAGQPLPPQLYRPDPDHVRAKPIDLPTFAAMTPQVPATPPVEEAELPEDAPIENTESPAVDEEQVDKEQIIDEDRDENVELVQTLDESDTATLDAVTLDAIDESASGAPPELEDEPLEDEPLKDTAASVQQAFRALNLQERFLSRLSSLAADANLSAARVAEPAEEVTAIVPLSTDSEHLAHEIVVDDEPLVPQTRRRRPQSNRVEPTSVNPLVLPDDQPVPTPDLHVTTGELIAGKTVNIRVRLPNVLPRIYVKLWVTDRQTRSLLDGPRWLVDFLPNGHDELEALTQLTVPFGSLEIGVEAIAIEMHTQRESRKVAVDRAVVPPDLPAQPLEIFDLRY
ncbi:hypothetical protein H6F43_02665 [Leptolyngbya sp. FACHB-36]|uniref:hypothetical protein n=1 Tax=Leptolyngbya sp. FACHB-36 TaxID=2692808 RepID=UPI0016805854|nr:hypothetical protein [Leptolyngbya sp. FACHB-36]MBD2019087.1 hypothetical protein [Leptolyngbya sp. FACHB-36]